TLNFSTDTLNFGTVFSPLGSTTFVCKVYNRSEKNLIFDEVRLRQGGKSPFLMIVDGRAGESIKNVRLAKQDSLFILVEVKKSSLSILMDEIIFFSRGTELDSKLYLEAFAEDVILIESDTLLDHNVIFTSQRPYVLQGDIIIGELASLTLEAGAILYFAREKGIIVNGHLNINGTKTSICQLTHLRSKEDYYSTALREWKGIVINARGQSIIEYANIKGAETGITIMDTSTILNEQKHLTLTKSVVNYCEYGLHGRQAILNVDNSEITNCSKNAILIEGGEVRFYNTTVATFSSNSIQYHLSQLSLRNFWLRERDTIVTSLKEALFAGCIIYGSNESELNIQQTNKQVMDYLFDHCILRVSPNFNLDSPSFFRIMTGFPSFLSLSRSDFRIHSQSIARNANSKENAKLFPIDLLGNNRLEIDDLSIGCYAFVP
ncbi:MAG: hypothetical protein ACRC3G_02860, partial [Bacteroidales bacterium]